MDPREREPELLHRVKNLLAINLGFCDLLLEQLDKKDPKRRDVLEIQKATREAMTLLPALGRRPR